jgi:hypothetical protein
MVDTTYRVVPGAAGEFDVQMARPNGQVKTATGFGSEHEATAWIVQAKRMKRDAAPWTPLVPRKPGSTSAQHEVAGALPGADGDAVQDRPTVKR